MGDIRGIMLNGRQLNLSGGMGDMTFVPNAGDSEMIPLHIAGDDVVDEVIEALGVSVLGRVDSEKNIILSGPLSAGTYTLKYEHEDGSTATVGEVTVT